LGGALDIRSAAEALHKFHPDYYFLIDRDHHSDEYVERSWARFPDPEYSNILIWRCRELENYFLEPAFLAQSTYLKTSIDRLRAVIIAAAKKRLLIDCANFVIVSVREDLKKNWIEAFSNPEEFRDEKEALSRLVSRPEFAQYGRRVGQVKAKRELERRFRTHLRRLTGSTAEIHWDQGDWLKLLKGKKILPGVVSRCFKVDHLRGRKLLRAVLTRLVSTTQNVLPADFVCLRELIFQRIQD